MSKSALHSPCRILLIEEDELVRALLEQILEDSGYQVLASAYPLDPLDIDQLRPDLLMMDIVFRGNHIGWDYLRLVRSHIRTSRLPVLICTAEYEQVRAATSTELGLATALVLKPFDVEDLVESIRSVLTSVPSLPIIPSPMALISERELLEG